MGSSGKSGNASKQDNYYATLAGAICVGPVDALVAVVLGGKYFYKPTSPLLRSSANAFGYTDIVDTRAGARGGILRFYWGTETQTTSAVLTALAPDTPPYAGVCYFVLVDFLFGTAVGSAPNLEFIVRRSPQQSVVTGAAAELDAVQQANPVASAAEVLTAWHGLNLPSASLDGAGWQSLAAAIQADATVRALADCSALWTSQAAARSLLLDLGAPGDLWFRLGSTGLVEVGRWTETGPAGAVTTLDANALVAELDLAAAAVDELATGISVDFSDRDYAYAESAEKVDDLALLRQQGRPTVRKLSRKQVTIRSAARAQGAAELRRAGRVILKGSVKVRRARAVNPSGTPIRPGDWFKLDVDPEPGGAGVALLCRCTGRLVGPTGPVTLEWESDPGAVPEGYLPGYAIADPEPEAIGPLDEFQLITLPFDGEGGPWISLLAVRPEPTWERVEVFYSGVDWDGGTDFTSIGSQFGFACPATLVDPLAFDDGVVRLALISTLGGGIGPTFDPTIDANLLREATGTGVDLTGRNDELLLVLVAIDPGSGTIRANGDLEWVEVCSVVDVAPVSAGVYDVTILRARLGTKALDFGTFGGTVSFPAAWNRHQAYVLPRSRLSELTHADFADLLLKQTPGLFHFAPSSASAVYDPVTAEAAGLQGADVWSDVYYSFPAGLARAPQITLTSPANGASVPTSGSMSLDLSVADNQDDLVEVRAFSVVEATGATTEHLRRALPLQGAFSYAASVTLPAVEGNHRVVVQAADQGGRVVQQEALVFRFTTATPVPLVVATWLGKAYYVKSTLAGITAGDKIQFEITRPAGIDYGAVPHTIQRRKRAGDGTWGTPVTFTPNAALVSPVNFILGVGEAWGFRLKRDGDGEVSAWTTLKYSEWLYAGGVL